MKKHSFKVTFHEFAADGAFTPNAQSVSIVNRGTEAVTLTVNETSTSLGAGQELSIESGEGRIDDEFTFVFAGASKDLLFIVGKEESVL